MRDLSRRQFFQYITARALKSAEKGIAKTARALQPRAAPTTGTAECARCYARFDPVEHEILCSACSEHEAKQHELLEEIFNAKD